MAGDRSQTPGDRPEAGVPNLAVIGGRLEDDNERIYAEMHRLTGGRILIFPTASSEPEEVGDETLEVFQNHGFDAEVARLYGGDALDQAHDPSLADRISEYGAVFFTGGDQAQILGALVQGSGPTPALAALRDLAASGGLISGSSAGAAMMSQPMLLGGTSLESCLHGPTDDPEEPGLMMGDGLGFFPWGMVDQHFIKRGRLGRLVVAMAEGGAARGFGIDENTALFVEGDQGRVIGEYGVMVINLAGARIDHANRQYQGFQLSYIDDGDSIDLRNLRFRPGPAKRRVKPSEMTYVAAIKTRRNVFGAYTIYDLMARLVLADPARYDADRANGFDPRTGFNVRLDLERRRGRSGAHISTPKTGIRMTATNFRASITSEKFSATRIADRTGRKARTYGVEPDPNAKIILVGSSPMDSDPAMKAALQRVIGDGPVGVLATASSEPGNAASDHIRMFRGMGVQATDLGITIDNVDYVEHDQRALEDIVQQRNVFLTGGNQIRLVDAMLHRGEQSAVLRAVAHGHLQGGTLLAVGGAATALSGVMIAGGDSYEALRYGVASDVGHAGLVIQEGLGLFGGGIVDQYLIRRRRLGRLIVACAEEYERYGVGLFEDSIVTATRGGMHLEAGGVHGFVLVQIDPDMLVLQGDSFVADGIRLTLLGPGDTVDLQSGEVKRRLNSLADSALLKKLVTDLAHDVGGEATVDQLLTGNAGWRGTRVHLRGMEGPSAILDLECPRDEF